MHLSSGVTVAAAAWVCGSMAFEMLRRNTNLDHYYKFRASSSLLAAHAPTVSAPRGLTRLTARQYICDPGWHSCGDGRCCEDGYDCVDGGCCPSGTIPCTETKCYDPETQQCCENGACDLEDKCCDYECCTEYGYCGADGYCEACPLATTETETATVSPTRPVVVTVTISKAAEPDESLPEFKCQPMTVTNYEGATLEMDEECSLNYEPPEDATTSTSSTGSPMANAKRQGSHAVQFSGSPTPPLRPRQMDCPPYSTETVTVSSTASLATTSTVTKTNEVEPSDEGFKCPEMAVTNALGDELSLNEDCELEVQLADPTQTGQQPTSQGNNDTGDEEGAAEALRGDCWWLVMTAFVAALGCVLQVV